MGPPSCMRSVVDRNVVVQHMAVFNLNELPSVGHTKVSKVCTGSRTSGYQ